VQNVAVTAEETERTPAEKGGGGTAAGEAMAEVVLADAATDLEKTAAERGVAAVGENVHGQRADHEQAAASKASDRPAGRLIYRSF